MLLFLSFCRKPVPLSALSKIKKNLLFLRERKENSRKSTKQDSRRFPEKYWNTVCLKRYRALSSEVTPVNPFAESIGTSTMSGWSSHLHAFSGSRSIRRQWRRDQEKRELNERNRDDKKKVCETGDGAGVGSQRNPPRRSPRVVSRGTGCCMRRAYVFHAGRAPRISEICSVARNIVGWPSTVDGIRRKRSLTGTSTFPVCTATYTLRQRCH